jgi:hypothetical protein
MNQKQKSKVKKLKNKTKEIESLGRQVCQSFYHKKITYYPSHQAPESQLHNGLDGCTVWNGSGNICPGAPKARLLSSCRTNPKAQGKIRPSLKVMMSQQ